MNHAAHVRVAIAWILACGGIGFSENKQPDIVLMMADDLGLSDLGCYGGEIPTEHLNSLADNGVVFANFSNTSRCCPSRATLMTGCIHIRSVSGT